MLYVKCPKCNSYNWETVSESINTTTSENSKYSYGKGLAGSLLLGPIGAVAGIGGKKVKETKREKTVVKKCNICGFIQSYTVPEL